MAARRAVIGTDADQPVYTALVLGVAVGVFAAHLQSGRFDARLLADECSISSTLYPRRSAQRWYMRRSISAQSCDSVPPAPAWTSTKVSLPSASPAKSAATLSRSARSTRASREAVSSFAMAVSPSASASSISSTVSDSSPSIAVTAPIALSSRWRSFINRLRRLGVVPERGILDARVSARPAGVGRDPSPGSGGPALWRR